MSHRHSLTALVLASVVFGLPAAAQATDAWPSKPIHLVVPGGVGGVVDIRARWLAERLGPALGQAFVVENRSGAGGNIGMESVARSPADGYTLVVIHQGTMTMNPHLYARTGYDPLADFVPIARVGLAPLMLAVHPSVPARSVGELIALAKAKPGQLNYGSPGNGTPPHLAAELFKRMAGIDAVHVPFNGGGQETQALVGGQITYTIEGLTLQLPLVQSGRLRALGVTSARRLPALPDIPTLAESGLPGYEFMGWIGIAAPAATPREIVERLAREIAAIEATAEARDWFATYGAEAGTIAPNAFAAEIRAEHARWGQVIRDARIKLD
jgi:tripartite-type tricarboxylate transporter receptor subunit TctC